MDPPGVALGWGLEMSCLVVSVAKAGSLTCVFVVGAVLRAWDSAAAKGAGKSVGGACAGAEFADVRLQGDSEGKAPGCNVRSGGL